MKPAIGREKSFLRSPLFTRTGKSLGREKERKSKSTYQSSAKA